MTLTLRPAEAGDANLLALRKEDEDEVVSLGFENGWAATTACLEASDFTFALEAAGELVGLGGGRGDPNGVAAGTELWFLTSVAAERYPIALYRMGRDIIQRLRDIDASPLHGHVGAGYAKALRFYEALGFVVEASKPIGPKGALFHRISKEA